MADQDVKKDFEEEILSPYNYLKKFKGKEIRSKIMIAFNHWLQVPADTLRTISEAAYMIHIGSLLIDDIQDDSQIRRGVPAAHCVYGVPLTINAGMYIFFLAFDKIIKLHTKVSSILSTQMVEVIRGQGTDIYWREKAFCPTENQYKLMAEQKSGRMFSLPVQIMQLFSDNKTDYTNLALLLGSYFQIRDDYCNLMKQEALEDWVEEDRKQGLLADTFCEDITEGKFSFPVVHAMQSAEAGQLLDTLRQRTRNVFSKKNCLSLLEKTGSLQYTREVLTKFDQDARAELARFGGNPEMEAVLDELLDWQM